MRKKRSQGQRETQVFEEVEEIVEEIIIDETEEILEEITETEVPTVEENNIQDIEGEGIVPETEDDLEGEKEIEEIEIIKEEDKEPVTNDEEDSIDFEQDEPAVEEEATEPEESTDPEPEEESIITSFLQKIFTPVIAQEIEVDLGAEDPDPEPETESVKEPEQEETPTPDPEPEIIEEETPEPSIDDFLDGETAIIIEEVIKEETPEPTETEETPAEAEAEEVVVEIEEDKPVTEEEVVEEVEEVEVVEEEVEKDEDKESLIIRDDFVEGALTIEDFLSPEIFEVLVQIEEETVSLGKVTNENWEDREFEIDVTKYIGQEITPEIIIRRLPTVDVVSYVYLDGIDLTLEGNEINIEKTIEEFYGDEDTVLFERTSPNEIVLFSTTQQGDALLEEDVEIIAALSAAFNEDQEEETISPIQNLLTGVLVEEVPIDLSLQNTGIVLDTTPEILDQSNLNGGERHLQKITDFLVGFFPERENEIRGEAKDSVEVVEESTEPKAIEEPESKKTSIKKETSTPDPEPEIIEEETPEPTETPEPSIDDFLDGETAIIVEEVIAEETPEPVETETTEVETEETPTEAVEEVVVEIEEDESVTEEEVVEEIEEAEVVEEEVEAVIEEEVSLISKFFGWLGVTTYAQEVKKSPITVSILNQLTGESFVLSEKQYSLKNNKIVLDIQKQFPRGKYEVTLELPSPIREESVTLKMPNYSVHGKSLSADKFSFVNGKGVVTKKTSLPEEKKLKTKKIDVTLAPGTEITAQNFDLTEDTDLEVSEIDPKEINDTDNRNIVSSFEFGTPGVPLVFSSPVRIDMQIDKSKQFDLEYDPEVFVRVQHEGESTYDDNAVSLDSNASCDQDGVISDPATTIPVNPETGIATFYTCKTSTYLGISSIDPAGSCWEIKERDDTATDGIYWLQTPVMTAAEEFYCDMTYDGGGWVLLGRGREAWAWNNSGVGTAANIRNTVTGTAAFTTEYLPATKVDELLNNTDISASPSGIRLRRVEDNTGSTFQNFQWFLTSLTNWSWTFTSSYAVQSSSWDSASQGVGSTSTADDTQTYFVPPNNILDVETNTLANPSNSEGFAYGANLFGGNTATDWGYQRGSRSTIPFTQVFIRPEVLRGPLLSKAPTGQLLWVDAMDIDGDGDTTNNPANGATVSTWVDKSGNGNDLTAMGAGATLPTYDTTGFLSSPTVQIDGTQLGFDMPASFSSTSNDYTFFAVLQQADGAGGFDGFYFYDQNTGGRFVVNQGTAVSSDAVYFDGGFGPTGFGDDGDNLATWVFEQGATNEFIFRRNGAQITTDATVTPFTLSDDARLGARYTTETVTQFDGVISELMIFDSALSTNEIALTERYLDCKWNITGRDDCEGQATVYDGGADTTTIGTAVTDIPWSDLVVEDPEITRNVNTFDFDLQEGGHYLVMYSVPTESTGGSNRSEIQSWLRINDSTDLPYGRDSGYIRRNNGADEGYNQGAAILNEPPGSTVRVQLQRSDSNTATVDRRANKSGINILKLRDDWDYMRTRLSSDQTMTASFADVVFDTDDELDTDGFSRTGGAITLKQPGHYLVTYNTAFEITNNTRTNNEATLVLDSTGEIDGTRSAAYLRGSNSTQNGIASFVGIIETTTTDDVLRLQVRRESSNEGSGHVVDADNTGLTIVKLPDTAEYVRLNEVGGGQVLSTTRTSVDLDTATEEDTTFTHSPSANDAQIQVNQDGDYLFLHSMYNVRSTVNNGPREAPFFEWALNGIAGVFDYGGSGSFNRESDDGNGVTNSSASSSGFIAANLSNGDTIELTQINEASLNVSVLPAGRMGIQGVYIPSLFAENPNIVQNHYRWRDDSVNLNTTGGWEAVEDTGITSIARETPYRVRIGIANDGINADSVGRQYELQWGDKTNLASCSEIVTWTDIDNSGDEFELFDSSFIADGASTTSGLLANVEGYTFVDGEGQDLNPSTTATLGPLDINEYTELEYSLQATEEAVTGHEYCFRIFDSLNATVIDQYTSYPEVSIKAMPFGTLMAYGTETLTGVAYSTVTLPGSFVDPIVVASPRYDGSTTANPERSVRVDNKTSSSFDIKVDNHDNSVSGSTVVDWAVFEQGDYEIDLDGGGTMQVYADSINTASTVVCNSGAGSGGDTVNFPTAFSSDPSVFFTVTSDVDTSFTHASIHGVGGTGTEPSTTAMVIGLDTSFEACGHGAEDIDFVAIEEVHDDLEGVEFEVSTSADNVLGTPIAGGYSNVFDTTFTSTPQFTMVAKQKVDGINGGVAYIHTGTATSTSNYYTAIDEFGVGADRAHTDETVSILAFTDASGIVPSDSIYLDQTHFRWYENVDSVTPSTALEAENTRLSASTFGDRLRLRILAQNGVDELSVNETDLKLQFGQGADCSAVVSWSDVGAAGSASVWRGFDNVTPSDGSDIVSSLLSGGGHALQSYVEENPTVLNPTLVTVGGRAEWDFVIENNGATGDDQYCFRMVSTTGAEMCYTQYATANSDITTSLTFDISDVTTGFGTLTSVGPRFATGDEVGTNVETVAHQISLQTTAINGYVITVEGESLTNGSGDKITPIGAVATASIPSTPQFGMRLQPNLILNPSGTGVVSSPYNTANYAYDGESGPSIVATGVGDGNMTDFDVTYIANIDSLTPAGDYQTKITFIATGEF